MRGRIDQILENIYVTYLFIIPFYTWGGNHRWTIREMSKEKNDLEIQMEKKGDFFINGGELLLSDSASRLAFSWTSSFWSCSILRSKNVCSKFWVYRFLVFSEILPKIFSRFYFQLCKAIILIILNLMTMLKKTWAHVNKTKFTEHCKFIIRNFELTFFHSIFFDRSSTSFSVFFNFSSICPFWVESRLFLLFRWATRWVISFGVSS